MINSLTR